MRTDCLIIVLSYWKSLKSLKWLKICSFPIKSLDLSANGSRCYLLSKVHTFCICITHHSFWLMCIRTNNWKNKPRVYSITAKKWFGGKSNRHNFPPIPNVINVFASQFCTTDTMHSYFRRLCLFLWIQTTLPFVGCCKIVIKCITLLHSKTVITISHTKSETYKFTWRLLYTVTYQPLSKFIVCHAVGNNGNKIAARFWSRLCYISYYHMCCTLVYKIDSIIIVMMQFCISIDRQTDRKIDLLISQGTLCLF